MKKILLCLALVLSAHAQQTADEITYDWLVKLGDETGYTDHVPVFKKIFKKTKVKNLLEFGLGYSTKYFLDSCSKVISVEFVTRGCGSDWIRRCLDLYQEYPNWIPIVFFTGFQGDVDWAPFKYVGSQSVYQAASYQSASQKSYAAEFDGFYLLELNAFIGNILKYRTVDLAFVDCGIFVHGDLVQLLFDQVPIILAHDTAAARKGGSDPYGYSRIQVPGNYEEIYIPLGVGTTVWIAKKEQHEPLIEELKKYAKSI